MAANSRGPCYYPISGTVRKDQFLSQLSVNGAVAQCPTVLYETSSLTTTSIASIDPNRAKILKINSDETVVYTDRPFTLQAGFLVGDTLTILGPDNPNLAAILVNTTADATDGTIVRYSPNPALTDLELSSLTTLTLIWDGTYWNVISFIV